MTALAIKETAARLGGLNLKAALDAAGVGDTMPAGNDIYLRVANGNAAACTVTVMVAAHNAGPRGTFLAPQVLTPDVAALTGDRLFGPFPADTFADPADGLVHLAYSVTATVTVGVYRITN